ncbi:nitroreductase [Actinoplanes sp. NPDC024001]|uniref:Acg family FMN-binding oxidoreductase n=1 Tax=unclassified Actinoplanes TaxID=2626549 RepID=UPI002E1E9868
MTWKATNMIPDPSSMLTNAAVFAARAPSLHNTQPWHWHVHHNTLELSLDTRRVLPATDPDARLAILSCGAALHHAVIRLAADGQAVTVQRQPDTADPTLLARVRVTGTMLADQDAVALAEQVPHRRTDRRTATAAPVDLDLVRRIREAVKSHGCGLIPLSPRQLVTLAEAVEAAHHVEALDPQWQVEVAGWVGGNRPDGTGIPTTALPEDPYLLTAPARALRRAGAALIADSQQRAAVFTVLHGPDDLPQTWLRAGEALSAGWLTATSTQIAVLPLSIVAEVATTRDRIRAALNFTSHPFLVLRLAAAGSSIAPSATPRLPAAAVITRS